MLQTIIIKRSVAIGFSVLISSAIPFLVQDKPRIAWAWDKAGPMIIDAAKDRVDSRLDQLDQE